MSVNIGIVNYGAGNIRSVQNAFSYIGAQTQEVIDPDRFSGFSHLVLPGVGSFHHAMNTLVSRGVDEAIYASINQGIPILGICLGMQLLATRSSEGGESVGLRLIAGDVDRLTLDQCNNNFKVPNVGFSPVDFSQEGKLFSSLDPLSEFYFTHSYRLISDDSSFLLSYSNHSERFVSAVESDHVVGTQFHPEKSQSNGLKVLENFITLF